MSIESLPEGTEGTQDALPADDEFFDLNTVKGSVGEFLRQMSRMIAEMEKLTTEFDAKQAAYMAEKDEGEKARMRLEVQALRQQIHVLAEKIQESQNSGMVAIRHMGTTDFGPLMPE